MIKNHLLQKKRPKLPSNYSEALEFLRNPGYIGSKEYRKSQLAAEYIGGHPDVLEFARKFRMRCRKNGIPVYAAQCGADPGYVPGFDQADPLRNGEAVQILHCEMYALPEMCWQILGHMGEEMAAQNKMPIVWAGMEDPSLWHLRRTVQGE